MYDDTYSRELRPVGNGLLASIRVVIDPDADLSWLGEWTDRTADEHGCGKRHIRNDYAGYRDARYFCPSFGCDDRPWGEWYGVGVIVEITTPAGTGSASLWGLDANDGEYVDGVADDLVDEALDELTHAVARKTGWAA